MKNINKSIIICDLDGTLILLEIKKDQFTGKIIQHPYGFNKSKIIKERFGSDSLVGVGNSIYDMPFLSKCKNYSRLNTA